jgi:Ca2+-binding EF-hand superfamily protein
MVIEKLFENIRKEMAPKTGRVTFDSFIELVNSFSTRDVDQKVERFFNLIDEDGNGELSFEEILHLC